MKAITVGTKMTLTRNYNARLLQTNGRYLTLSAGSVVRVKQVSGLVDDSRVHGVNISCMIPEGHIVVTEIHNGWDTFNSMIVPISALRDETEIASKKASRVIARKVQINASNGSQPERFKTAREAQEAADECNVPGEIHPVIVGCCGPQYYVLLIDSGKTVKYYSELSETWIPVPVNAAGAETVEPEVKSAEGKDQGRGDSTNEEELAAGKEQINAADAAILEFIWSLAEEQGFKRYGCWKDWGCNEQLKADNGTILLVFNGRFYPPKVRTERGEYDLGGISGEYVSGSDVKMKPFFDTIINQFPGLTTEREYEMRWRGPYGPVLSMDMDEMLLACQQIGRGKRQSL